MGNQVIEGLLSIRNYPGGFEDKQGEIMSLIDRLATVVKLRDEWIVANSKNDAA